MRRPLLCLSATLLALLAWTAGASANHVSCGDVIALDTTLDGDLLNCPGDGVVIGADYITLDLAGHTIDGTGAGVGGQGVDNDAGHDGVTVRRGSIQEFQAAVYFDHGDGGLLRGLTITDSGAAFQLFDSDFNVIERNVVSTGIALYADSDANTIDRNASRTAGTAVLVGGFDQQRHADGNLITQNRLIGSGESFAIYVFVADDTLITGNDIRDHSDAGISVNANGQRTRIEGNTVSNTREGIALDGFLTDTLVLRNRVLSSDTDGIRLSQLTERTTVERNTSRQNGGDGIDSDVASATITRNVASHNGDLGIEAVPGVTDGGDNRARGNGNPAQCMGVSCN
jgi:parallel beta-helix repeat protein